MYALFFWIGIALLGLFVYILPCFTVQRMYEAYEDITKSSNQENADPIQALLKTQDNAVPTKVTPNKLSPNVPTAGTTDFHALAQSVKSLLGPGTTTPDMEPVNHVSLPPMAVGAKPQPDGASTVKSTPQTAMDAMIPVESSALQQGVSFQNTKPSPVIIVNQVPKTDTLLQNNRISSEQPNMKDYIRRDMIPKPKKCAPAPQCPDMSKYIRKDSIPCWACKL